MKIEKPDWIRTSDEGSFAEFTIKNRKPDIIEKILELNSYSEDVELRLNFFCEEITNRHGVKPLTEIALDSELWNSQLQVYGEVTWFDLPWYFAESFFYRRLLECTGYYQIGHKGYLEDPFSIQKQEQMRQDLDGMLSMQWLFSPKSPKRTLSAHLLAALWGNRADLSNLKVNLAQVGEEVEGAGHLHLLIDGILQVETAISETYENIAYVTDNVGRELFADLALVDYILTNDLIEHVTFMVKPGPLFVSDAMRKDVDLSVQLLCESTSVTIQDAGRRIQSLVKEGRLIVLEEPSLCDFHMFEEMPWDFGRNLAAFDLVIIKGDANYRRVIGDRHWKYTQPIDPIVEYFPSDLLLMRTLKSEIMVGLTSLQVEELNRKYENWLVDGFCGVVQLVKKKKEEDSQNE